MDSLKKESSITTNTAFQLPSADTFAGAENYVNAVSSKGFLQALGYTVIITVTSVAVILICCSMIKQGRPFWPPLLISVSVVRVGT